MSRLSCFGSIAWMAIHFGCGAIDPPSTTAESTVAVDRLAPILSYAPSCADPISSACLTGTEIQALERFGGALWAGTSSWNETEPGLWPARPAQVLVLDSALGAWRDAGPLPDSQAKCGPGVAAPWEQVNDLHAATLDGESRLFVATNADGACPTAQGSVFYLHAAGEWVDTGLSTVLSAHHPEVESEVRYVVTHSDDTGECPADAPCLFALVNPRGNAAYPPAVWRGRPDRSCGLVCWDPSPEIELDGAIHPQADRLVAAHDAGREQGFYVGTQAARSALLRRLPDRGVWRVAWQGAESGVRGITSWRNPATGVHALWWLGNDEGQIYRQDSGNERVVREARMVDLGGPRCSTFYGYQLHLHATSTIDPNPVLVVASEGCGNEFARLYVRNAGACPGWRSIEMPSVRNDPATPRVAESAVRWIESSPFDPGDLFFGTTDMNSGFGSLTARIYRLEGPFTPSCR